MMHGKLTCSLCTLVSVERLVGISCDALAKFAIIVAVCLYVKMMANYAKGF